MRVAIIHYWLVGMRGGEKVLEELCDLYPDADIFTHVFDRSKVSKKIADRVVGTTFVSRLPRSVRMYKTYLPFMFIALEQLDLQSYDLIISSEAGPAKGIIPRADALHICYCHSPMRYIWNMYYKYKKNAGFLARFMMPILSHYLRQADILSSTRVHEFVANSHCVKQRIKTYYGRDATVIYPPVQTDSYQPVAAAEIGDFYLVVSELVAYKRADLAIDALVRLGRKLVVIGGGDLLSKLRAKREPNVNIMGPQSQEVLQWHYAHCRALIFPGEEDFGIVPVEAMASGRPVIAYGRGGATESVIAGVTGVFFHEQTVDAVVNAVLEFEGMTFDQGRILEQARCFSGQVFRSRFKAFVDGRWAKKSTDTSVQTPHLTEVRAAARR